LMLCAWSLSTSCGGVRIDMVRTTARNIHALLVLDICDDWTIEVDCHDEAGDPLELLGAQSIEWKLTAADGSQVALLSLAGGDITVKPEADPEATRNKCIVRVAHALTAALAPGVYTDRLRVKTFEGITTTQSTGHIEARAV
jgi:hypothetical protein